MGRLISALACDEHGLPIPTRIEIRGGGQIAVCLFCGARFGLWECACELGHDCEGGE